MRSRNLLIMTPLVIGLLGAPSFGQSPYYYGTYPSESGSNNPAPENQPDQQPAPPPVVYQQVPVYRRAPIYDAPAWASPNAAALGPWPWNFDFGGGPTTIAGSNNRLNGGSNFEVGGGYNFTPRTGFVLEFMNAWLGVTDNALQQNGAVSGDASIWSVTLNPIWRFRIGGPIGAYIIAGGGYYQLDQRFDEPQQIFVPADFFHPAFTQTVIQSVHQYDDTGGVNAGLGLTWNWGWGTKFFIEARYHYIFTSGTATQIVPVTFGFRW
jgi:Outer membrane protein beta-barrel domain